MSSRFQYKQLITKNKVDLTKSQKDIIQKVIETKGKFNIQNKIKI